MQPNEYELLTQLENIISQLIGPLEAGLLPEEVLKVISEILPEYREKLEQAQAEYLDKVLPSSKDLLDRLNKNEDVRDWIQIDPVVNGQVRLQQNVLKPDQDWNETNISQLAAKIINTVLTIERVLVNEPVNNKKKEEKNEH